MRFVAGADGTIGELRYFRGAADAGDTDVRTLHLWSGTGTLLGQVTVTAAPGESGWQTGILATPVAIEAGVGYVVSYGTTQNYAFTGNYFTTAHAGPDGVLTAGVAGGVFANGTPGLFPTQTYNSANYWVDVAFQPEPANNGTGDDIFAFGASDADRITVFDDYAGEIRLVDENLSADTAAPDASIELASLVDAEVLRLLDEAAPFHAIEDFMFA